MNLLLAAALMAVAHAAPTSSAEALPAGRVIRSLPTTTDPSQSYALYLPSAYTPARSWPILYCFDPGARGAVPVELFAQAAEAQGWVVVGSNNSRNGPQEVISAAVTAIWADTQARLKIDPLRMYATGFSGGARVASVFAAALGFAGLVGVGAGLNSTIEPTASLPFVYFGIAGRDDFNYFEVHELHQRLTAAGVPSHIEQFDGGHSWPPKELAAQAVEWLDLMAMRAKKLPTDAAAVERYAAAARARIGALPPGSYERFLLLQQALADLQGLADVTDLQGEVERLRATKPVVQGAKRERDRLRQQRRRDEELAVLRRDAIDSTGRAALWPRERPYEESPAEGAKRDLERLLAELGRLASAEELSDERTVARRSLYGFLVFCRESAREARRTKDYDLALALLRWVEVSQPKAPALHVQIAALRALKGDAKQALRSLERAADLGLADGDALTSESAFDSIRSTPEFQRLLARVLQQATTH